MKRDIATIVARISNDLFLADIEAHQRRMTGDVAPGFRQRAVRLRHPFRLKRKMSVIIRNVAREKLEQGELSLGVGVRMTRSVEIAIAMKAAGFDWLFLDLEHGTMSIEACGADRHRGAGCRHRADRARAERRIRDRDTRCSTTARSASSCRMSTPRPRRARWCRS